MVLTRIVQGPITDVMPIIINPMVPGMVCYGCTVALTTVTVEYEPVGAVREPDPTLQGTAVAPPTAQDATITAPSTNVTAAPHSVGVLSIPQGLGISANDPLPLDLGFSMDPRNYSDLSDFSIPLPLQPLDSITSGSAARLYRNEAQSFPFSASATAGSTSSTIIHPYMSGIFDPHHSGADFTAGAAAAQSLNPSLLSTGQKRSRPPGPAQDKQSKRQKLETRDQRVVDQQVGAHQVDPIRTPTFVPSFDHPQGMSKDEYAKLLRAKLVAECGASALD
jgi:hypothetical protein